MSIKKYKRIVENRVTRIRGSISNFLIKNQKDYNINNDTLFIILENGSYRIGVIDCDTKRFHKYYIRIHKCSLH